MPPAGLGAENIGSSPWLSVNRGAEIKVRGGVGNGEQASWGAYSLSYKQQGAHSMNASPFPKEMDRATQRRSYVTPAAATYVPYNSIQGQWSSCVHPPRW